MSKTITTRISNKTDTEQNWNNVDLVALNGELIVYSTDASHSSPRVKIGDGTTQVKDLPFIGATGDEATTSKAGLMSAADKEKMDSLGYENLLLNSAAEKTITNAAVKPVICEYGRTLLASRATRLVLTFEAKSDVATNVDAYPRKSNDGALSGMAKTVSVTTDWTNFSIVFSLSAGDYGYWSIRSTDKVSGGSSTATVTVRNIKLVVTENEATTSSAGLMSSADKSKVDGLQASLDAKQVTITGAATTITGNDLTASRALVSNSSGKVAVSTVTSTELSYLDGVKSGIQAQLDDKAASEHTHSSYVNQNAFSNIKVGSTIVAADTATDTVEFVGSNVTITPDATNDKVTFAVVDGSTSAKGVVQLTNSTSSTSTTTAATPAAVKLAYDLASGKAPAYQYSTTDLTAGTSALTTGTLYFVYA